jgi:hypothetical protein
MKPSEKASRMEKLSQVYFSAEPAGPPEACASPRSEPEAASIAFVPVCNMAGSRGGSFLRSLRAALGKLEVASLHVSAQGACYRVRGQRGKDLSGIELLRRLESEKSLSVFLLEFHGKIDGGSCALMRSGDLSLLLVSEDVPHLREAFANLKRLASARGGTLPTVIPVLTEDTPWSRIAAPRLAEAASRFLRWRLPLWGDADAGECARRIGERLRRIGSRREGGREILVHRLSPLLEVAS